MFLNVVATTCSTCAGLVGCAFMVHGLCLFCCFVLLWFFAVVVFISFNFSSHFSTQIQDGNES